MVTEARGARMSKGHIFLGLYYNKIGNRLYSFKPERRLRTARYEQRDIPKEL